MKDIYAAASAADSPVAERLRAASDAGYRDFQLRLMPTVPPAAVLGVRTPALRALARELSGTEEAAAFLAALPHKYYDENNLHGFLIALMRDFGAAVAAVDAFLPYVDNWATCDLLSPKVFKKHTAELLPHIRRWLASGRTYTVRFAIEMLMSFYLDGGFRPEYAEWVAAVSSGEYYVNMMRAWYFATALAKRCGDALPYLEERRLDKWTHNKTVQKAVESYRITDERKAYLRSLRVK